MFLSFLGFGHRTQIDDALRFNLINYFGNASRECPSGILPDLGRISGHGHGRVES